MLNTGYLVAIVIANSLGDNYFRLFYYLLHFPESHFGFHNIWLYAWECVVREDISFYECHFRGGEQSGDGDALL